MLYSKRVVVGKRRNSICILVTTRNYRLVKALQIGIEIIGTYFENLGLTNKIFNRGLITVNTWTKKKSA